MKKILTVALLIVMLVHVLPFDALATVGKVLSEDELARAYALTGLGTGGLPAAASRTAARARLSTGGSLGAGKLSEADFSNRW